MRVNPVIFQDIHQAELLQNMADALSTSTAELDLSSEAHFETQLEDVFQQISDNMGIDDESLKPDDESFARDTTLSIEEVSKDIYTVFLPFNLPNQPEPPTNVGLTDNSSQNDHTGISADKCVRKDKLSTEKSLAEVAQLSESLKQPTEFDKRSFDRNNNNIKSEIIKESVRLVSNVDYLEPSGFFTKTPLADLAAPGNTVSSSVTHYASRQNHPALHITGNGQQARAIAELPELGQFIVQMKHTEQGVSVTMTSDTKHIPLLSSHLDSLQQIVADNLPQPANPTSETGNQKSGSDTHQNIYFSFNSNTEQSRGGGENSDKNKPSYATASLPSDLNVDRNHRERSHRNQLSGNQLIDFRV